MIHQQPLIKVFQEEILQIIIMLVEEEAELRLSEEIQQGDPRMEEVQEE
tara:strand:- start:277 stop:423 length:147 start_codon:yes stop_codon:yes gene_type:complete